MGSTIKLLQNLEQELKQFTSEEMMTTFETKEEFLEIIHICDDDDIADRNINQIRRAKKNAFWLNSGMMKISTIHSFKGWEIHTLFLIIDNATNLQEDGFFINDELIYTAITRARCNLIVINMGNKKYHDFFSKYI